MNTNRFKILLIRNIFSNIGDEAMLCSEIDEIQRSFPNAQLTVLTDDPQRIRDNYKVETDFSETVLTTLFSKKSNRFIHNNLLASKKSLKNSLSKSISNLSTQSLLPLNCRLFVWNSYRLRRQKRIIGLQPPQKKLLEQICKADIVLGGGGLIPSIKGIFLPKVALYKSLSALRVPFILHGQTVLPDKRADEVYCKAERVLLRDQNLSRKNALAFGVSEENLVEKLDPAFFLPIVSLENLLDSDTLKFVNEPFIAINLREWKSQNFDNSFAKLAISLNRFHELNPKFGMLFFSMQEYGVDNDFTAINKLRNQLSPTIQTQVFSAKIRPSVLTSVLAKALAVITSRYHGAVFPLSNAVPTIGISVSGEYDAKLNGIFSMFEASEFLLSAHTLETNQVSNLLNLIAEKREAIVSKLRQKKVVLSLQPQLTDVLNDFFANHQAR